MSLSSADCTMEPHQEPGAGLFLGLIQSEPNQPGSATSPQRAN